MKRISLTMCLVLVCVPSVTLCVIFLPEPEVVLPETVRVGFNYNEELNEFSVEVDKILDGGGQGYRTSDMAKLFRSLEGDQVRGWVANGCIDAKSHVFMDICQTVLADDGMASSNNVVRSIENAMGYILTGNEREKKQAVHQLFRKPLEKKGVAVLSAMLSADDSSIVLPFEGKPFKHMPVIFLVIYLLGCDASAFSQGDIKKIKDAWEDQGTPWLTTRIAREIMAVFSKEVQDEFDYLHHYTAQEFARLLRVDFLD